VLSVDFMWGPFWFKVFLIGVQSGDFLWPSVLGLLVQSVAVGLCGWLIVGSQGRSVAVSVGAL
jgi:hypothetical protein